MTELEFMQVILYVEGHIMMSSSYYIIIMGLTDTSSGSNSINLEPEGEPGNYDEDDGRDVDLQDVKSNISLQDESDFQTGICTCKINQFIFQLLRYDLDIILLCLCVLRPCHTSAFTMNVCLTF